jgi:hypothetical protein
MSKNIDISHGAIGITFAISGTNPRFTMRTLHAYYISGLRNGNCAGITSDFKII